MRESDMCDSDQDPSGDQALFSDLLAWIEGGEKSPELTSLEVSDPARFGRLERSARQLVELFAERPLGAWSEERRQRALSLSQGSGARAWLSGVKTLVARLVTPPAEPALAMRGADEDAYFRLYELEGYDLDLSRSEGGVLMGQILPREEGASAFSAGDAMLQVADRTPEVSEIGEDGLFRFNLPASGSARLILNGDGVEVVIGDLDLPEA